jgi:hypothetical protein
MIEKGMRKNARAIKFSDTEMEMIDDFLKLNPFLDFSKLIRIAVTNFLEDPKIQLKKRVKAPQ